MNEARLKLFSESMGLQSGRIGFPNLCFVLSSFERDAAQVKKLVEWEQKPESHGIHKRWPLYKLDD